MSESGGPVDVPPEVAERRGPEIGYLSATVLPVLEGARSELAASGVTAVVDTSWTGSGPASEGEPVVTFYCGEPGVPSGTDLPIGEAVEFTVVDGMLSVSAAGAHRARVGDDDAETAIRDAVNRAVATYYARLEDSVR